MASTTVTANSTFDAIDFLSLARVTSKTFKRLAPYTLLQKPSSPEARPVIIKTVNKLKSYIEAIDTSIQVVHMAYRMSKLAASLWTTLDLSNEKHFHGNRMERQHQLEELVLLADETHQKAYKTAATFNQAEQDFYRVLFPAFPLFMILSADVNVQIAASTKAIDCIVQIPADPALPLPKMLEKPLKDIGTDLVSNLNVLAEFTRHITDFATWCGWVKSSIIAIDGAVVPTPTSSLAHAQAICSSWDKIRADCLVYHSLVIEIQERHPSMLPVSTNAWQPTLRETNTKYSAENREKRGHTPTLSRRVSSILQDAVRHLSCHTQSCFAA
ncbi:hypothetical protein H0H92_003905 [Tricholoma furcatifolium]|nr:hypothetical protein H0H92_003905 [Tricholoma furcatifolium]